MLRNDFFFFLKYHFSQKFKASKFFLKSNKLHPQEKTQKYYEMAEQKKKGNNHHQEKKSPTKKEKEVHNEEIPQKKYTKQQALLKLKRNIKLKNRRMISNTCDTKRIFTRFWEWEKIAPRKKLKKATERL